MPQRSLLTFSSIPWLNYVRWSVGIRPYARWQALLSRALTHAATLSAPRHDENCADDAAVTEPLAHSVPGVWDVVASMAAAWRASGPALTLGELLWGSQIVAARHEELARAPGHGLVRGARPITDIGLAHELADCLDMAAAAYKRTPLAAAAICKLKATILLDEHGTQVHDVASWRLESSYLAPGYMVALDHGAAQVVWAIRGTRHGIDLLTDLASAHPYMEGHTHWGMHQAARWLLHREAQRISGLLQRHPGYTLHLVGHSMGGGVAAIIAHMAHTDPAVLAALVPTGRSQEGGASVARQPQVHATCFAPPCIMSAEMARSCRPYVRSVILGDDIVPRLNAATVAALRDEIRAAPWRSRVAALLGVDAYMQQVSARMTGPTQKAASSGCSPVVQNQAPQPPGASQVERAAELPGAAGSEIEQPVPAEGSVTAGAMPRLAAVLQSLPLPLRLNSLAAAPMAAAETDGNGARGDRGVKKDAAQLLGRLLGPLQAPLQDATAWYSPGSSQRTQATAQQATEARAVSEMSEESIAGGCQDGGLAPQGVDLSPSSAAATSSSELDLGSWSARWRAAMAGVNEQLAGLRGLPPSLRQAVLRMLETPATPGGSDGAASNGKPWPRAPRTHREEAPVVHSDGSTCETLQAELTAHAASSKAAPPQRLYPAGQLFYLQPVAAGGRGALPDPGAGRSGDEGAPQLPGDTAGAVHADGAEVRLLEVPEELEFPHRALLTRQALRDHRSRAYRQALYAVLGRDVLH